ncbi:IclR family transcriptional regulator [Streptomyces sp. TS71-3]|uniref:IclR family transcriptional regulator n=1 Tax=Streptomyces sp. TS71-3 TaxID=2733862 RepID=UPI001B2B1FDF|nr:IclR family transcriptional regulator [Streptomyces sp. TS71-3]GHJ38696.1 IclR family transcriptional regulator [Streptomyces sp. TS71-3]
MGVPPSAGAGVTTANGVDEMAAIERAAQVLEALAASDEPLGFAALAGATGLPKSSLHNVCASLTATGLVDRLGDGRYRLGLRLVELSQKRLADSDLVSTFNEACAASAWLPDESIVLAVLDGVDTLYLGRRHGSKPIAVRYQKIGMRLPAALTATGKSLLSTLKDDEVRALFAAGEGLRSPYGPVTKTVDELVDELRAVRSHGYAVDDGDTVPGMICFGAPIAVPPGRRLADDVESVSAVGFSVVKSTVDEVTYDVLVTQIQKLADRIAKLLTVA